MTSEPGSSAGRGGLPAPAVFGAIFAALLVSTGAAALVMSGVSRTPDDDETPTPTLAALVTASPEENSSTSAPAGDGVRVLNASGTATAAGEGRYRVTFTWTLQGATENDEVSIFVYSGNQLLGEEQGTLDPSVFSFSTGRFTLTALVPCSSGGWSAVIRSVRGSPVEGDSEAIVPGVNC